MAVPSWSATVNRSATPMAPTRSASKLRPHRERQLSRDAQGGRLRLHHLDGEGQGHLRFGGLRAGFLQPHPIRHLEWQRESSI
jgi:hypothetical protein